MMGKKAATCQTEQRHSHMACEQEEPSRRDQGVQQVGRSAGGEVCGGNEGGDGGGDPRGGGGEGGGGEGKGGRWRRKGMGAIARPRERDCAVGLSVKEECGNRNETDVP